MDRKRKFCRLIEKYINKSKIDLIEQAYGKNASIKIHNISYSITNPSVLVEAVIVLGDEINESVLDRSVADYVVEESTSYFFSDLPIKVMIRWDV